MKEALKKIKYFLLDLDGTVYLGNELIGRMNETLDRLRECGKKIIFLTNNSSKSERAYREKLFKMDLFREGDEVYTSGMATAAYLKKNRAGKSVYLLGTDALKEEFSSLGVKLVDGFADVSVLSYDTELTYEKLCRFTYNVTKGSEYIATHPDVNCPAPEVFVPDVGSYIALVERSTGKTPSVVIGKPFSTMGDILAERYGAERHEFMMVGDRLHTDIKFGNNCRFKTLFVLSGECTTEDLKTSDAKPDFILNSLNDITDYL